MLEELIEAVEMMDGRGLHQTDHARSKPWRCCYVPVISFRVYRVGTQGPRASQGWGTTAVVTKRVFILYQRCGRWRAVSPSREIDSAVVSSGVR